MFKPDLDTLDKDNYLKMQLTEQDMKFVGKQLGGLLWKSGILKELEPIDDPQVLFKDDIMYQWRKEESKSSSATNTPGKIEFTMKQNGDQEIANRIDNNSPAVNKCVEVFKLFISFHTQKSRSTIYF